MSEHDKYHEMEARRGQHVTLPYATPQQMNSKGSVPLGRVGGVSAIVPFPYTIVDSKTLGQKMGGK